MYVQLCGQMVCTLFTEVFPEVCLELSPEVCPEVCPVVWSDGLHFIYLCSKFLSTQILFWNSNFIFRIMTQFLESKLSFSLDISRFYVMIYNSKTWIGFLNSDLDFKLELEF